MMLSSRTCALGACTLLVSCSVAGRAEPPLVADRAQALDTALAAFRGLGVAVMPKSLGAVDRPKGTPVAAFGSRDAAFGDVMLALFKDSNINLMMEGEMPGKATFDIKSSTLEETFEQLLAVYDLAYRWEGSFLRVERRSARTFLVDYPAQEGAGSPGLSGGGGQGSSGSTAPSQSSGTAAGSGSGGAQAFWSGLKEDVRAMIASDPGALVLTNTALGSITVEARPSSVRRVSEYLDHAKRRSSKQVSLEARVLEVTLNGAFKFGVNYALLPGLFHSDNTGTLAGGAMAIGGAASGGTAAQIGYLSANRFSLFYDALETQGQVRVLSSPRVSTLNNISASIRVVEQVPVIEREIVDTTGASRTQFNVRFVDAGITVNVTPQIGDDGVITAVVEPAIVEVAGYVSTPDGLITEPILNTRNLKTIVKVKDGQALVMGGLRSTRRTEDLTKIPLLGDIPGLGSLFRSTSQTKADTEIVIVIYPRLLTPEWEREDFERGVDRVMRTKVPFAVTSLQMEEPAREWTKDHLDGQIPPSAAGVDRVKSESPAPVAAEGKPILSRAGLSRLAFTRACQHLERGEAAQAQQALEDALNDDPGNAEAWFVKGLLALRLGRLSEAEAALLRASQIAPSDAAVANALGLTELRMDEAITAEGRFRQALAASPLPEIHCNLGIALLVQGKLVAAEAAFRQALSDPKTTPPEAHVNLAVCLDRQGKRDAALVEYRAYLLSGGNPKDPRLKSLEARLDAASALP